MADENEVVRETPVGIIAAPAGLHAFYPGEKPGDVLSEPVIVIATMNTGKIRAMTMDHTGSDELGSPGDKPGFLGIGRIDDQEFWESESKDWWAKNG